VGWRAGGAKGEDTMVDSKAEVMKVVAEMVVQMAAAARAVAKLVGVTAEAAMEV